MFSQWAQTNDLLSGQAQAGDQLIRSTVLDRTILIGETVPYCNAKRCAGSGAYSQSWSALIKDSVVFKRWLRNPSELENFLVQGAWLGPL